MESRAVARVEKGSPEGRTIVFIDESGFYLLPMVVRTYAPCGCTPILKEYLSYDHLSVIGAVTPQGRLFLKTYMHSITSREVVAFLGQLQRLIPGLLLVIWDGSPTHRSQFLRDYLASGATQRLHLERLPGYAPELNPTEWVWSYLKLADLANIACDHLPELDAHLYKAKKRLQRKPNLIRRSSMMQATKFRLLCRDSSSFFRSIRSATGQPRQRRQDLRYGWGVRAPGYWLVNWL